MNQIKYVDIFGVHISCVTMKSTVSLLTDFLDKARGNYICVSNVHTTIMATENQEYMKIQNSSYLSLPDGKPLSIYAKIKKIRNIERVTGPDLMEEIFKISEEKSYKHYFYGNTPENLEKLITHLKEEYPALNIVGYQPSIFRDLTDLENSKLIEDFNESQADFIWIGLGAPKQEVFMYKNQKLTNSIMIGVGGAFNVLSGVSKRAPKWMQKLSLEWLFRLIDDPQRLFKRYFITNTKFIYKVLTKW